MENKPRIRIRFYKNHISYDYVHQQGKYQGRLSGYNAGILITTRDGK